MKHIYIVTWHDLTDPVAQPVNIGVFDNAQEAWLRASTANADRQNVVVEKWRVNADRYEGREKRWLNENWRKLAAAGYKGL